MEASSDSVSVGNHVDHNQTQDKTFAKTQSSIDGQLYEIALITLLLLKGLSEDVDQFYLASNMKKAHKLDDIVFKCKLKGIEKMKLIFLQAKHRNEYKQNKELSLNNKNKVTLNQLLPKNCSKNGDFNLQKYFESYLKIRRQFSKENRQHPIFGQNFEDLDCDIIIYTNSFPAFHVWEGRDNKLVNGIEKVDRNICNISDCILDQNSYYKIVKGKNKYIDRKIETLKCVSDNDDDINEFLSKLKLFFGQPNRSCLESIIKLKIRQEYEVTDADINPIYSEIQSRVLAWWNKDNYYLQKENKFIPESIRIAIKFEVKVPTDLFAGRKKELLELNEILKNESKVNMTRIACVTGLGGIGKSELVKKYISINSRDYDDNIFWINAENYQTLDRSFRTLAKIKIRINTMDSDGHERDILTIIPEVYKYFSERHRKSLFIFDNAEKYKSYFERDEGIDKFLPTGPNKSFVLITSRDREWDSIKLLPLDTFTEQEAAVFIRKALGDKNSDFEVIRLAKSLHYFPLALRQAVAYILGENNSLNLKVESAYSITDYLLEYVNRTEELLKTPLQEDVMYDHYRGTIFTTWNVTINKIRRKRDGLAAVDILNIIAYLASDKIPVDDFFHTFIETREILHSSVELLNQYSMAHLERGMLSIHRLVQEVTRMWLEKLDKEEEIIRKTFTLLRRCFRCGSIKSEDCERKKKLLNHVEVFSAHVEELEKKPEDKQNVDQFYLRCLLEELLVYVSDGYSMTSNALMEMNVLERVLSIKEKRYGKDAFEVGLTLANLSNAYGELGDPMKQKEILERALPILENYYGCEHFEVAKILVNLASAYGDLGEYRQQKSFLKRALEMESNFYGTEHPEVASTLVNLGIAYGDLGQYQKEKYLLERALPILENHYGSQHFNVARTYVNLANAYGDLGNPLKKKELLHQALPVMEQHYGPKHIEVAKTLVNLGNAYGNLGSPQKEKDLLERALLIEEDYYGPDHFQVAKTLGSLGIANGYLGDQQLKVDLLERALTIQQRYFGHEHNEVSKILADLGNAYGALNDHKKKKDYLERALMIREKYYGPEHVEIAKLLVNLAMASEAMGDFRNQRALLEKGLPILNQLYCPEHFEVSTSLANINKTLIKLQKDDCTNQLNYS